MYLVVSTTGQEGGVDIGASGPSCWKEAFVQHLTKGLALKVKG